MPKYWHIPFSKKTFHWGPRKDATPLIKTTMALTQSFTKKHFRDTGKRCHPIKNPFWHYNFSKKPFSKGTRNDATLLKQKQRHNFLFQKKKKKHFGAAKDAFPTSIHCIRFNWPGAKPRLRIGNLNQYDWLVARTHLCIWRLCNVHFQLKYPFFENFMGQ